MIELGCYFPVDWLHIYSMRPQAKRMLVIFLWSLVLIGQAVAYHSGPPYTACSGMAPDSSAHGAQAQVGPAPYTLTFSKNTYAPNDQITVTLSGNSDSDTFRGFFIQPRTSVNTYSTVGTISNYPPNSRNPCENEPESQRTAISHNNKTEKDSVTFTWTAPATDSGPVIFVYTVVKVKVTYWVKLQADPITFETATSNQPASSSNEPTSTLTSTQPTTPLPNKVINWDPACGTKKGCYPGPAQCSFNCDYLVKWMPVGDSDVQFTLQRKAVGDKWIAVGFSADVGMGNDSVVECASVGGQVVVRSSYNEPSPTRANNVLDTISYGIGDAQTSHIEGVMSCTFTRKISAEIVMGRRKRATTDETQFFDLNTEWYLLVAQGDMAGTTKLPHSERPKVSSEKIDFLSVGGSGVTQKPLVAGEITKGTDCGKTEGCLHDCDSSGKQCTFYVSWKENGNDIDMMIQSKQTVNRYSALGLSSDQNMGDDSVIECVAEGNSVTVYVSHNVGKTNERLSPGIFGISKVVGSIKDGVATCSFSRKKTAALAGRRKRAAAGQSNYFSMDDDWYLLFATGPSSGGNIFQHDKRPVMSSQKADFQLFQDLGAQAAAKTLVKVHGILMVLAWMMLASIGIVCPRFYKSAWPDETSLFGQKIWFQIHRACMVLAFLACAASFIIIFVHVGGYAEIVGSNFEKAHPILGIVVTALAVINPIMAIFRPHPGTPKRPIFNVAHLLVGSGAHVIGIVNLFAGVLLASAAVEEYVLIVLYVFVGWQFLFEVILYIHQQCFVNKKGFKADMYELKGSEPGSTEGLAKKGEKRDSFKIVALYIHILVIIGLSVAVCVIIGISNHDHEDGEDH